MNATMNSIRFCGASLVSASCQDILGHSLKPQILFRVEVLHKKRQWEEGAKAVQGYSSSVQELTTSRSYHCTAGVKAFQFGLQGLVADDMSFSMLVH